MVQKELCPQRESPAEAVQGGQVAVWRAVCACVCVHVCLCLCSCSRGCVSLCAVCKARSAIFNIPVSLDLEYQNNLSGSIQMLLPLHTFLPPPSPPPPLLCFLPSLPSHIWSTVSSAIPLTKLIFASNGGLSLNKTFVWRDR